MGNAGKLVLNKRIKEGLTKKMAFEDLKEMKEDPRGKCHRGEGMQVESSFPIGFRLVHINEATFPKFTHDILTVSGLSTVLSLFICS